MSKDKLDKLLKDYDNYRMPKQFSSTARQKEIFFNAVKRNDKIQFQKYRNKLIPLLIIGAIITIIVVVLLCI